MNLPVKVVYDILMNDENITSLINPNMIFMIDVPEDYQKVENAPIIRINEISDYQEDFASNKPFTLVFSVQVDVWANNLKILESFQTALDALMSKNYWSQYSGALDKDPDIDLFRLARRYRTTQTIDFE